MSSVFENDGVEGVTKALKDAGLGSYAEVFAENEIDVESLAMLSMKDIEFFEVKKIGHQKKILKLVEEAKREMIAQGKGFNPAVNDLLANAGWDGSMPGQTGWGMPNSALPSLSGLTAANAGDLGSSPLSALRAQDDAIVNPNSGILPSAVGAIGYELPAGATPLTAPVSFVSQQQNDVHGSSVHQSFPPGAVPIKTSDGSPAILTSSRLFVSGIPQSAMLETDRIVEFLRQHFSRYGKLVQVDVTKNAGEISSCALIEFAKAEAASLCMSDVQSGAQSGMVIVDGHQLEIRYWQRRGGLQTLLRPGGASGLLSPPLLGNGANANQGVHAPAVANGANGNYYGANGAGVYAPPRAHSNGNNHTRQPRKGSGRGGGNGARSSSRDGNDDDGADVLNLVGSAGDAYSQTPVGKLPPLLDSHQGFATGGMGQLLMDGNEEPGSASEQRRVLVILFNELLRRDAHCAPHHHPCSAIAAKRIFSECTGQSFEQILQLPFFDVVHAIESYTDLFSICYVPDGRAGVDEMKWRFRANGPVRKRAPKTRRPAVRTAPPQAPPTTSTGREPWE